MKQKSELKQFNMQLHTDMEDLRGPKNAVDKSMHELRATKRDLEQEVEETKIQLEEHEGEFDTPEKPLRGASAEDAQHTVRTLEGKLFADVEGLGELGRTKGSPL